MRDTFKSKFTDFIATSRSQFPAINNPYSRLNNKGKPVMDTEAIDFQKTQLLHL